MQKLATFAVLFVLAFGIAAGLTAVNANAIGFRCQIHPDQYVCTSQTGPLCTNPLEPYYLMQCRGVYVPGGGLCDCFFIGCCEFPDWP
jgi:hypothetical protein